MREGETRPLARLTAREKALADRAYPWAVRGAIRASACGLGHLEDCLAAAVWAVMRAAKSWREGEGRSWRTYAIQGIERRLRGAARDRAVALARRRLGERMPLEEMPGRAAPEPAEELARRESLALLVLRLQRLAGGEGGAALAARAVLAGGGAKEAARLGRVSASTGRHMMHALRREMADERRA